MCRRVRGDRADAEVLGANDVAGREDHRAAKAVLELTHVARPAVVANRRERFWRHHRLRPPERGARARHEVLDELRRSP